jgi:hypothetical protein
MTGRFGVQDDDTFEQYDFDPSVGRDLCTAFAVCFGAFCLSALSGGRSAWNLGIHSTSPTTPQPVYVLGGVDLQLLHAGAFLVGHVFSASIVLWLRWAESKGGAPWLFVRRYWNPIASLIIFGLVVCMQTCRCIADLRRAQPGNQLMLEHVVLNIEFETGALPKRSCIDSKPWETALMPVKVWPFACKYARTHTDLRKCAHTH